MHEASWTRLAAVFEGSWASGLMAMSGRDIGLAALIFVAGIVVSFAAVALIVTRLPPDYFVGDEFVLWADRPAWQRALGRIGKNLLGVVLIAVGVVLSVPGVPGQGFITIFIGIVLVDFPGKRRLEQRIMARPRIFKACNKLRVRWKRAPFLAPEEADTAAE